MENKQLLIETRLFGGIYFNNLGDKAKITKIASLATLPLQSGVSFHGGNSKYNPAAAIARAYLVSNFGWTITDGGAA